ncbi:MAG: hypothetical protein ACSHXI_20415 [Hoeflea sp.]|uniref:hypothetical protein n=1 Tax=Hoeflea sp. TaxID=1940281 RepID=UPI003EF6A9C5
MIVGANLVSNQTTTVERPLPARASTVVPAQNEATDPLAALDNFVESAALSRKAFAEDRLNHLKEQMNTLALFNLAPGFLAGHTARMAKELESAATDFATAFKTLAGLEQPSTMEQATDSAMPRAYLDILADDTPVNVRLNTQDAETAASFMDTAYQLRSVVEMISSESRDNARLQWSTDSAKDSTSRVSSIMARLEAPSAFNKVFW